MIDKKHEHKDIDDDDDEGSSSFKLIEGKKITHKYEIYLGSSFDAPEEYFKIFHLLTHAKKEDEFVFYLNSYGGRVDTGIQFAAKLSKTKAHTKTVVESPCYSMGAIFPFLTKEVEMHDHTFLMWHDASIGFGRQKLNEINMNVTVFRDLFLGMLKKHCSEVLTETEIENISNGQDVYLTKEQIQARLRKK